MIFFITVSFSLNAQKEQTHSRIAEMFQYPFSHFSYVQARFDRQTFDNSGYYDQYAIRAARVFGNSWHLRLDVPLANTNVPQSTFGLADIGLRLMHSTPVSGQIYTSYGAELIFPTATDPVLGGGKWLAHPEVAAIYFFGTPSEVKGSATLGFGYLFDYAGQSDRAHVSQFRIAPNVDYWGNKWYIGYYATWTYDIKNKIFDLPLDIEAGYTFVPKWTLAAEYIQPLVNTEKITHNNEFAVKLRYMLP